MASEQTNAHAADTMHLTRQSMNAGYQVASLLTPPTYLAFVIARRGRGAVTLNRLLRATWLGGLGGLLFSGGVTYVRYVNSSPESARVQRMASAYDKNRIRKDDHSVIGAILTAVISPALFWKRASIVNLILGGAGLGSSLGLVAYYIKILSSDLPPSPVIKHSIE